MTDETRLPNDEKREDLDGLINDLQRARTSITPNAEVAPENVSDTLRKADKELGNVISELRSRREDIPEWDRDLVRDLVLEHADKRDTDVRRVDTEVVFEFEVGQLGNEKKLRYAHVPGGDSQWLHVMMDGDWEEVWSS